MNQEGYELIDCGEGRKLERFGSHVVDRPCAQAIWKKGNPSLWKPAHGRFERITDKEGRWKGKLPGSWKVKIGPIQMKLSPTPFGHLGIFPEHLGTWPWLKTRLHALNQPKVLNLFAYSGASTLYCASQGAHTVHLDASRPVVNWAKENASLTGLPEDKVVWILDDVGKFLEREIRRGRRYDGILLDPPSFGRGPKKELFKIESDLGRLLHNVSRLLTDRSGAFVLASCHTPGISPVILSNLLEQAVGSKGHHESGEMLTSSLTGLQLPSGIFARWSRP